MTGKAKKLLLWAAACVGLIPCLVIAFPVASSVYMEQRLKGFVKIETVYPGCSESGGTRNTTVCECEFIFEGVTDSSAISFSDPGLTRSYNNERRIFRVRGTGRISSGNNSIQIMRDRIVVNSTTIPADRPSAFHVLIKRDGTLRSSRWDLHW
jgi:hypothetical protein